MKATLPDGTVIEGTAKEMQEFLPRRAPFSRPIPMPDPVPYKVTSTRWGHSPNCPNPSGGPWFSVIPCCNGSAGYAVTTTAATADFDPPGDEYPVGDALGLRRVGADSKP